MTKNELINKFAMRTGEAPMSVIRQHYSEFADAIEDQLLSGSAGIETLRETGCLSNDGTMVHASTRNVVRAFAKDIALGGKPDIFRYSIGDYVRKHSGDARYSGHVVSCYLTIRGKARYVIDVDPQGFQMIVSETQIEHEQGRLHWPLRIS